METRNRSRRAATAAAAAAAAVATTTTAPRSTTTTAATPVRRSTRERKPIVTPAESVDVKSGGDDQKGKKRKLDFVGGSSGNPKKKGKVAEPAVRKNPRRNSARGCLEDAEGRLVWVVPVKVGDIQRAQQTKKDPFHQTAKNRLFLYTVAHDSHRHGAYERAQRALADIEATLLPTYGQRPWKVTVTVTDPPQHPKNLHNQKAAAKTKGATGLTTAPYFVFDQGRLELAVWPHLLLKIPTPPTFPGYTTAEQAAKQQKRNRGGVQQEEDESDDGDEVISVDEDTKIMYNMQERAATSVSELAWEDKLRYPVVHTRWMSPMRKNFSSRRQVWDHATELCRQQVLIDRVLQGYASGGRVRRLSSHSPPVSRAQALKVGGLRFIRDGLWVVGQEEAWREERRIEEEQKGYDPNKLPSVQPRTRKPTALALYVQHWRRLHQTRRQKELDDARLESQSAEESADLPSQPHRKFTLREADQELREQWKQLDEEERQEWIQKAQSEKPALSLNGSEGSNSDAKPPAKVLPGSMARLVSDSNMESKASLSLSTSPRFTHEKASTGEASSATASNEDKRHPEASAGVLSESDGEMPICSPIARRITCQELDLVTDRTETGRVTPSSNESGMDSSDVNPALLSSKLPAAIALDAGNTDLADAPTKIVEPVLHRKPAPYESWVLNDEQIKLCYNAGVDHYESVMATVKARDLSRELQDGFDLLRERGRGRYDMELPVFDTPAFSFLTDLKKAPWMPIVRQILGKDVVLIHKGMFLSLPGAEMQQYHQDGLHLNTQYQKPCHAINVFIPLIDLTMEAGPTEFCLGTHILENENYNTDFLETPLVKAGTPIIFDYRLGHKGLANTTRACRPVVYCTYASSADGREFRDSVNFSRKRYHRIGDLVTKGPSREERAEKRNRSDRELEQAIAASLKNRTASSKKR